MKIDFKGLLQGIYNKHLGADWKKAVAKDRYENHCVGCQFNSTEAKKHGYESVRPDEHCTDCGCNLDYKTHCMHCNCPRAFWVAVMTEDESQKLNKLIDENDNT